MLTIILSGLLLLPEVIGICSKSPVPIVQYLETFAIYTGPNNSTVEIRPQSHLPVAALLSSVDSFVNQTLINGFSNETDVGDNTTVTNHLLGSLLPQPVLDCSTKCLHEIQTFMSSSEDSILHVRGPPAPLVVPWGYLETNPGYTMYCARSNGTCGATVPLYRHYKISAAALYHSYSFGNATVKGYVMEPTPLCYAWPVEEQIQDLLQADDPAPSCMAVESQKLVNLNYYANDKKGFYKDHMLTTHTEGSNITEGYHKLTTFGRVLPKSNVHLCSCVVQLNQMRDNQTGLLGRTDTKLVVNGTEPDQPYEKYSPAGETFYCATEKDACGATIPLYKHFQVVEMDSIYTTKEGPLYMAYPYPALPLCYIWPTSYRFSRDLPNRAKKTASRPSTTTTTTVLPEAEDSLQETTTVVDGTTGVTQAPAENTTVIDGSITIITGEGNTAEEGATVTQKANSKDKEEVTVTNGTSNSKKLAESQITAKDLAIATELVEKNNSTNGDVTVTISNGNNRTAETTTTVPSTLEATTSTIKKTATVSSSTKNDNTLNELAQLPLLVRDSETKTTKSGNQASLTANINTTTEVSIFPISKSESSTAKDVITVPQSINSTVEENARVTSETSGKDIINESSSGLNSTKNNNTAKQPATVTSKTQSHLFRQTASDEGSKPMSRIDLTEEVRPKKDWIAEAPTNGTLSLENSTSTITPTTKPALAVTFKSSNMENINDNSISSNVSKAKTPLQITKRNITSAAELATIDSDLTRPFVTPGTVTDPVETIQKVAVGLTPKPIMAVVNATVVLLQNTTDVSFKKVTTTKPAVLAKLFKTV